MPKQKASADYQTDPHLALAKAQAERYAARADYENLLNERGNKILGLSESSGPKSEKYLNAKKDLDRSEREYERIYAVIRRPLSKWAIPLSVLVAFGLALAFFEAPVNKFLFDVALQSTNLASYGISFAFACALLLIAHVSGISLRHIWSDYRKRIVWSALFIFLGTMLVLIVLVGILTIARATFSVQSATIHDLLSDVGSAIQTAGVWGALRSAFGDISALVLATVNIGGIFMTMMFALFTHDPDKDFDAVSRAVARNRGKLERIVRDFLKRKDGIMKDAAPDIAGVSANYKSANMNVIELKRRLGQPLDEEDSLVIDKLDTVAEDSEHWPDIEREIAGAISLAKTAQIVSTSPATRREPKITPAERSGRQQA